MRWETAASPSWGNISDRGLRSVIWVVIRINLNLQQLWPATTCLLWCLQSKHRNAHFSNPQIAAEKEKVSSQFEEVWAQSCYLCLGADSLPDSCKDIVFVWEIVEDTVFALINIIYCWCEALYLLLAKTCNPIFYPSGVSRCVYSGAAVLQQSGGGGQSVHATANERLPFQERHRDL